MKTAEKLARLYPGKKWRVLYKDDGSEEIEWGEAIKKPSKKELDDAVFEIPLSLESRIAALEAVVFKK